jgi:hypothetical protein
MFGSRLGSFAVLEVKTERAGKDLNLIEPLDFGPDGYQLLACGDCSLMVGGEAVVEDW